MFLLFLTYLNLDQGFVDLFTIPFVKLQPLSGGEKCTARGAGIGTELVIPQLMMGMQNSIQSISKMGIKGTNHYGTSLFNRQSCLFLGLTHTLRL